MDAALVSISIAAIGLIAGLLGAFVAGRQQTRFEEQKWRATRQDELEREKRTAIAELTRKIVMAVQVAARLAWHARHHPSRISVEDTNNYERRIHELLPDIMSSVVVVSALDSDVHNLMYDLVRKVYNLDDRMSKAIIIWEGSQDEGAKAMADCLEDVIPFWGELNQTVSDMFRNRQ
jgi:hypothetical protein